MRLIIVFVSVFFCGTLSEPKRAAECIPYVKNKSPSFIQSLTSPKPREDVKDLVKFLLFTKESQNCYQILTPGSIKDTYFNSLLPIRFIIHGWRNEASSGVNREIKDAYLTKGKYNIIIVDWGAIAQDVNYNYVTKQVDKIGKVIADFAETLHKEMKVSYNKMYLIGHSLGAQIAGHAGHVAKQKFEAIFALDPAGPKFKDETRIDELSAKYVESIHTDMTFAGVGYPVGHASFFPNYGKNQNGCKSISKCSHSRAYQYFAESINSAKGFWGIKCSSFKQITDLKCTPSLKEIVLMGGEPAEPKKGWYYFPTNKENPFAMGQDFKLKS